MKKSKKFLIIAFIFMAIVCYAVYDMTTKTSFPKGKPPKSKLQDTTHMIIDSSAIKSKNDY